MDIWKEERKEKKSWDILECDLNWYIEIRRDDGQNMLQKKNKKMSMIKCKRRICNNRREASKKRYAGLIKIEMDKRSIQSVM